jgi:hypothetical protein
MVLNTTHHGFAKDCCHSFSPLDATITAFVSDFPCTKSNHGTEELLKLKPSAFRTTIILCLILSVLVLLLGRHFWLPIFCTGLMKTRNVGTWP